MLRNQNELEVEIHISPQIQWGHILHEQASGKKYML